MSKAYVKDILANGNWEGNLLLRTNENIHDHSPTWVLTFVRWSNRFPYEDKEIGSLEVRAPLVVESDCVALSVNYSKSSHTPNCSMILKSGDINYETAISPGDFVFVNILSNPEEAKRVAYSSASNFAINGENDGFKGIFKIQSVRKMLLVDPGTGLKTLMFQVQAFAFTEFNNTIYFNPHLLDNTAKSADFLFITNLSDQWLQFMAKSAVQNVETVIQFLIDTCIGTGISRKKNVLKHGIVRNFNVHFEIPKEVGKLLGLSGAKSAKDIYNYLFGVQEYSKTEGTLAEGMSPTLRKRSNTESDNYYYTGTRCEGNVYLQAEYWNQVTLWSILNQYTNSPINELYTCFRIDAKGAVMPTVVFRQIPFSSESINSGTKFFNLPRWRIDPALITDINLGRDETARINFVQVFGINRQFTKKTQDAYISLQTARKNWESDMEDIKRNGLKPYIINSNFDMVGEQYDNNKTRVPYWKNLLSDALFGGHLKMSGTIEVIGIVEPIAVGDNLELDGNVYHIESIRHSCNINSNGIKTFRTSIDVTNGLDLRTSNTGKRFVGMDNVDMEDETQRDWERDRMLPGFSEEQAIIGRENAYGENTTLSEGFFHPKGTRKKEPTKVPKQNAKKSKRNTIK